ncbi:MAG: hypothetical protein AAB225_30800 [Acidobacteriota bacterium]
MKRISIALAAALVSVVVLGQKPDAAEVELKAAMHKEQVDGDLKGAIAQYQKILNTRSVSRAVAAKALLQMGQCHEKLGNAEARKAYERLVMEFADQAEPARAARERLAALGTGGPGTEVAARRVWNARTDWIHDVSSDGRYVLFRESGSGNLAARELATGKTHRITLTASLVAGRYVAGTLAKISPDNRQVAYGWVAGSGSRFELHVAGFDGSADRVLLPGEGVTFDRTYDAAWMPDGKRILAVIRSTADQTYQRLMVTVADGSIQRIGAPDKRRPIWGLPSWDGRYIAYYLPLDDGTAGPDILLYDTRTERDSALVRNPAKDWIIGWTSNSKTFIFSSDRSGSVNFWAQDVEEGKPKGSPRLINRDPEGDNLKVTRDGTLFQIQTSYTQDVYSAELEPAGGKLTAQPALLTTRLQAVWMQWPPDSRSFCYRPRGSSSLRIRSMESGEEREVVLKPGLRSYDHPRWSPDGRSVLVSGYDQEAAYGLFNIDLQSGAVSRIVRISGSAVSASPSWSPDGKAVFYQQRDEARKELTVIKRRDLDGGAEKEVHRGLVSQAQLSPDGRQLAFVQPSNDAQSYLLAVTEVGGSTPREVARVQPPESITDVVWTSDGRYVLFVKTLKDQVSEIWRAATTGGQPERITALDGRVNGLRVHPGGRLLGLEVVRYNYELWALENYLSPAKATQ